MQEHEGLKVKYIVTKIEDGSVVEDCFILRPQIDEAARSALYAYAAVTNNHLLAADIRKWLKSIKTDNKDNAPVTLADLCTFYDNNIAFTTSFVRQAIMNWLNDVEADVIMYAMKEAAARNIHQWQYINAIIDKNFRAGRTTLAAVEDANRTFKSRQGQPDSVYNDSGTDYDAIEKLLQDKM